MVTTRNNNDVKIVQGYKLEQNKSKANNSFAEKIKASNSSIKNVYFYEESRRLNIQFKDGTEEIYNLENAESKSRAEKKYGIKLVPPPSKGTRQLTGKNNTTKEMPIINVQLESLIDKKIGENPKVKEEQYDKVFTVTQVPASFPGGQDAWQKYLQRNLNRDIPVEKGAPAGKYVATIEFVVQLDGTLAEVKIATNPGYGTGEEALRMIDKGPKWQPAMQNGRAVISRVKQNITFQISEE